MKTSRLLTASAVVSTATAVLAIASTAVTLLGHPTSQPRVLPSFTPDTRQLTLTAQPTPRLGATRTPLSLPSLTPTLTPVPLRLMQGYTWDEPQSGQLAPTPTPSLDDTWQTRPTKVNGVSKVCPTWTPAQAQYLKTHKRPSKKFLRGLPTC